MFLMSEKWRSSGRYILAWSIPALVILLVKIQILRHGGLRIISRHLGYLVKGQLTFWEMLSLFQADFLVCFILVPLVLLLLVRLLNHKLRALSMSFVCIMVVSFLCAQYQCWQNVGRLLSLQLFIDAIQWGMAEPEYIKAYLDIKTLVVFFVSAALVILIGLWASNHDSKAGSSPLDRRQFAVGTLAALCLLSVTGISWLPSVKKTSYHESLFLQSIEKFFGWDEEKLVDFSNLTPQGLIEQYHKLNLAPKHNTDSRYWGKARNSNVILFVFETGPAKCLSLNGNLDGFPTLNRLRDRAFISELHHSTYPYTERAIFSLLTSQYPSNLMKSFIQQHPDLIAPGIMRSLANRGYVTASYQPYPARVGKFKEMLNAVGVTKQFNATLLADYAPPSEGQPLWQTIIGDDLKALKALKIDMETWINNKKSFSAIFLPQIGHGPWSDIKKATPRKEKSIISRGRELMALQDAWLGQLVDTLERNDQIENTIIVVTSDHGIRTRQEDPDFQGGMIDEISFNVPLLIYAPQILDTTQVIPWLTSHIDITTTVLDLLGIEEMRAFEQGSPIWDSRLQERKTYFLGNHYFGSDGYYFQRQYYMWSQVSNTVYQSEHLRFNLNDFVSPSTMQHLEVTTSIGQMASLQQIWSTLFMDRKVNGVLRK